MWARGPPLQDEVPRNSGEDALAAGTFPSLGLFSGELTQTRDGRLGTDAETPRSRGDNRCVTCPRARARTWPAGPAGRGAAQGTRAPKGCAAWSCCIHPTNILGIPKSAPSPSSPPPGIPSSGSSIARDRHLGLAPDANGNTSGASVGLSRDRGDAATLRLSRRWSEKVKDGAGCRAQCGAEVQISKSGLVFCLWLMGVRQSAEKQAHGTSFL